MRSATVLVLVCAVLAPPEHHFWAIIVTFVVSYLCGLHDHLDRS